jgi:hypothetical protein
MDYVHPIGLAAEVNGQPTPDLDAFLALVRRLPDGADVRVRMLHYESGKPRVLTLKTDYRYWPTWELRLDPATAEWRHHEVGSPA